MPFVKGNTVNLGRKLSEKTKQKMSLAHKGSKPYLWGAGFKKGNIPWNCKRNIIRNAYFAGLVDGDGYISIQGNAPDKNRYHRIQVRITQVNTEAIKKGKEYWGGYLYQRNRDGIIYNEWVLQYGKAEEFLNDIRPFLIIKKEQANIALKLRLLQNKSKNRLLEISDSELKYRKSLVRNLKNLHLGKGRINRLQQQ